jgi:hypothetical protein
MQYPSSATGFMTAMSPLLCHLAKTVLTAAHGTSKMGVVDDCLLFVKFSDRWIFKEHEGKKKKMDMCEPAENVKQA